MKMQAFLSNGQHPEKGALPVTFPIPEQEYDRILDLLRPMGIGDAVRRDCQLAELDTGYSALKCLEGQAVNLDELDYLAKRLDSFDEYEAAQFEAALSKLELSDMTDVIRPMAAARVRMSLRPWTDMKRRCCSSAAGPGSSPPTAYSTTTACSWNRSMMEHISLNTTIILIC